MRSRSWRRRSPARSPTRRASRRRTMPGEPVKVTDKNGKPVSSADSAAAVSAAVAQAATVAADDPVGGNNAGRRRGVAAAGASAPGAGAWLNYDFVPGSRTIYYDDFTGDEVGDFPRRMKLDEGNLEVVNIKEQKMLRTAEGGKVFIVLPEKLPGAFHRGGGVSQPIDRKPDVPLDGWQCEQVRLLHDLRLRATRRRAPARPRTRSVLGIRELPLHGGHTLRPRVHRQHPHRKRSRRRHIVAHRHAVRPAPGRGRTTIRRSSPASAWPRAGRSSTISSRRRDARRRRAFFSTWEAITSAESPRPHSPRSATCSRRTQRSSSRSRGTPTTSGTRPRIRRCRKSGRPR